MLLQVLLLHLHLRLVIVLVVYFDRRQELSTPVLSSLIAACCGSVPPVQARAMSRTDGTQRDVVDDNVSRCTDLFVNF